MKDTYEGNREGFKRYCRRGLPLHTPPLKTDENVSALPSARLQETDVQHVVNSHSDQNLEASYLHLSPFSAFRLASIYFWQNGTIHSSRFPSEKILLAKSSVTRIMEVNKYRMGDLRTKPKMKKKKWGLKVVAKRS
jgi:hypothetical protein